MRKIAPPTEDEYLRARAQEALNYVPPIGPCANCGWPVVRGYCCNFCGSTDPSRPKEEKKEKGE